VQVDPFFIATKDKVYDPSSNPSKMQISNKPKKSLAENASAPKSVLVVPEHLDFVFFDPSTQAAWVKLRPRLSPHRFTIDSFVGSATVPTSKSDFVSRSDVVLDLLTSPSILVNMPDLLALIEPTFPNDDQLIQVPVKLGIFATSLSAGTTTAHNYAVQFFRQHFPMALQTLLQTGIMRLTEALGCAFETVQRAFLADVAREENMVNENALCALTVVLVDRNITGCVVVLNAGNSTLLQRDPRRGTYGVAVRAQLPPTRLSPPPSAADTPITTTTTTTTNPHVRIESDPSSSSPSYSATFVDPVSRLAVHSGGGFGSKYWVHDVFYADRNAQMRAAVHNLRASQTQAAFLGATREAGISAQRWAACCAHTIEVFAPSATLATAPTSLIVCNDSFFYGASARTGDTLDVPVQQHLCNDDLAAASHAALGQLKSSDATTTTTKKQSPVVVSPVFRVLPVCWQIVVTRRTK